MSTVDVRHDAYRESAYGLSGIRRKSLKDEVIEQILQAIQQGRLKPGTQVTELGLAKVLGISQSTVREAFIELDHQGFLQRVGPRKTCITQLTPKDVREIHWVRSRLEAMVVELLIADRNANLSEAEARRGRMAELALADDATAFLQADLEFHRALWRAAGNRTLIDVLEQLVPRLFAFSILLHSRPTQERMLANAEEHRQLMEYLRAGDGPAALALVQDQMTQQALLEH